MTAEKEIPLLGGLRVIELASVLAGPAVGMFLAELGAEVIKIEHFRQGGDVTRSWKLPTEDRDQDRSAYFSAVNWGKISVGIDLKQAAGRALVYRLVETADIVLASFKPGDAEKLGLDPATLRGRNPRLIYADLTAYGPGDSRVGFDAIVQAEAGFTYLNGDPGGPPTKMPVALIDLLAAHQLKEGILLALLRRERTGRGHHVRTSLVGAAIASLANQATNWLVGGQVPQRMGSDHPNIVPYGTIFPTRDGQAIVLAVGNDRQFSRLIEVLSATDLAETTDFRHNAGRVAARAEVNARLRAHILEWDRDALLEVLHAAHIPAGAVRDMPDIFRQPWAQMAQLRSDAGNGVRSLALDGFAQLELSEPPHLGAHTDAVLEKVMGLKTEEIAQLRAKSVVG